MTQDEIIEMAIQAGFGGADLNGKSEEFKRFAKLVTAKEREACAKVCEQHGEVWAERFLLGYQATLNDAADAIRARGEA